MTTAPQPRRRAPRWRRLAIDILLLPPALLYVLVENLFWFTATRLLHHAARIRLLQTLQHAMQKLPAAAILILFLIPEVLSHLGGLWATLLLVRGKFAFALAVGCFIKGFATLLTVWIYQSCAATLLSVKWFAACHRWALQGRDWVAERIAPARALLLNSRSTVTRRFRARRTHLTHWLGLKKR